MTDEVKVDLTPEEPAAQEDQVQEDSQSEEKDEHYDQAYANGWRPKEDFNGDPNNWVDSESFVKRMEKGLPMVNERNRRLSEDNKALNDKIEKMSLDVADMLKKQEDSMRLKYEAKIEDAKAKMKEAEEYQDIDSYKAHHEEALRLEKEMPKREEVKAIEPHIAQAVEYWKSQNQDIINDASLYKIAEAEHVRLLAQEPNLPMYVNLQKASEYARANSANTNSKPKVNAVEGANPRRSAKLTLEEEFNTLPNEIQAVANNFSRSMAWYNKTDKKSLEAKEKYFKNYVNKFKN